MKTAIHLNGRQFQGVTNSETGEVSPATRFEYFQEGSRIWGTYSGGAIRSGHLQGKILEDGRLEFLYHHENIDGDLMAGHCLSRVEVGPSGQLKLLEQWQWFTGD